MDNYVRFDSEASLKEARSRLPLVRVMEQHGQAPPEGRTKSFRCPHCKKKGNAGIFIHDRVEFFKCQDTCCPTGARAMETVGYIAFILGGRGRSDAFTDYLKMSGVWKERAKYQNRSLPERPPAPAPSLAPTPAEPPVKLAKHRRRPNRPRASQLQRRLSIQDIDVIIGQPRIFGRFHRAGISGSCARRKEIHVVDRCSP